MTQAILRSIVLLKLKPDKFKYNELPIGYLSSNPRGDVGIWLIITNIRLGKAIADIKTANVYLQERGTHHLPVHH